MVGIGGTPLVSAVMPTTRARSQWIAQAVKYFLRQDYPNRELVVASEDVLPELPEDERIRYVNVASGLSLGAKRNASNRFARGEIIAHWDDDDWYAPWRLSEQVAAMRETRLPISGCRSLLFLDLANDQVWRFSPADSVPCAWSSTLLYERCFWQERLFPAITFSESVWFFLQETASAPPPRDVCVAVVHGKNTSTRHFAPPRYSAAGRIENVIPAEDAQFYNSMRLVG